MATVPGKEKTCLVGMKPVSTKCIAILVKTDEVLTRMEHPFWYSMMDKRHVNRYTNNDPASDECNGENDKDKRDSDEQQRKEAPLSSRMRKSIS